MGKKSPQTFDRTQKLEEDLINHWKQTYSFDHHSQVPWLCLLLYYLFKNDFSIKNDTQSKM